jgi:hypothetical protein
MKTTATKLTILIAALAACSALSGCMVVGYSSGGGFFVWPGVGLLVVLLVLWLLLRGR